MYVVKSKMLIGNFVIFIKQRLAIYVRSITRSQRANNFQFEYDYLPDFAGSDDGI